MSKPLLLLFILLFPVSSLSAQDTTGTISGTISDQFGAPIKGASVEVRSIADGGLRSLVSDESGRYIAPNLRLGGYEIAAVADGFQAQVRTGISVVLGHTSIVDFSLTAGLIKERVVVHSKPTFSDTTNLGIQGLVSDFQVQTLPINARSFQNLIALQPGVAMLGSAYHGGDAGTGRGERISVSGARPTSNTYLLDGLDIKDANGQTPVSAANNMLGINTIYEFTVLANNYSAEYGGAGGVVNIVTRGGTNLFNGDLFGFHRNSALDAKNFFDRADQPIPLLRRNQFGGTTGGPLLKNKLFIFGSYEGLREVAGLSYVGFVPDENARNGLLPDPTHPGQSITVGVHPTVRKYLNLFPRPNGRNFGDGRAEFLSSPRQQTRDDHIMVRLDYKPNQSTSYLTRYSLYDGRLASPDQLGLTQRTESSRQQFLALESTKIFSSRLVNTLRFGYSRSNQNSFYIPLFPNPDSYNFLQGRERTFGTAGGIEFGFTSPQIVTTAPISRIGSPLNVPKSHLQNLYQYQDHVTYVAGSHLLKLGFEGKHYQIRSDTPSALSGTYLFSGALRDFLENRPTLFIGLLPGSSALRYLRQSLFGWYIQDEIKLKRNITLNLGFRHEFTTLIREKFGIESNLRHPSDPSTTIGPIFRNPSLRNFEPRVGISWSPSKDGKTSVRAGFGVFHEQLLYDQTYTFFNRQPPFFVRASLSSPTFPDPFAHIADPPRQIAPGIQSVDYDAKSPTLLAYNIGIQREVIGSTIISATYVGSRGYHLTRAYEANIAIPQILADGSRFFPRGLARRNPNFGSDWRMSFNANSFYNSLQLSANRRAARDLQLQVAYTFSKNIDDGTGRWDVYSGQSFTVQNPDDFNSDRALSPIDITHVLTFNYLYDIPNFLHRSRLASKLTGGWQIAGITNLSSGPPFTVRLGFNNSRNLNNFQLADRPNLLPGFNSNNVILGGPDRYFDPGAFQLPSPGTYGSLGRNTFRAPGIVKFDIAVIRTLSIQDRLKVQLRAEAFNLFNHPNFGLPVPFIFNDASGVPSANAGRIIQTSTPSRQIQLAVRLSY